MIDFLSRPWPWWLAGPIIGLMVPTMLWLNNRSFGISSNLRHLCAAGLPTRLAFFNYDWRRHGLWNLTFAGGIMFGAFLAGQWTPSATGQLSPATVEQLAGLGIHDFSGFMPVELFAWQRLMDPAGFTLMVIGGFLVGFGTRYAGGCTSGHAIAGLSYGHLASLTAVIGFFAGGLLTTHWLLPWLLGVSL